MPFELSIKYYAMPKWLADKYLMLYVHTETYKTEEDARVYLSDNFYGFKNDIIYENGKWKIVLWLYLFPKNIYAEYVHDKKIFIFENKGAATEYAKKNFYTYLYSISYTKDNANFGEALI